MPPPADLVQNHDSDVDPHSELAEDNSGPHEAIRPLAAGGLKRGEPRSVADGFSEFSERLVPKYAESEASALSFQVIESCLRKGFDLSYIAPYGSRGHGSNVQGFSAIDSFAVIPKSDLLEDSAKSLEQIREVLAERLPDVFITEGRPVVAAPFGTRRSERHHIVPAFHAGAKEEHDLFAVPAPRGRWIHICPAAHSIWINELDRALNGNLKKFIRAVKAWSYYNDDVIWRYYLELCAADYLSNDSEVVYAHDVCRFFDYLSSRELAPFENTVGCNEPVYGTSIADRNSAIAKVRETAKMAKKARACEQKGNIVDAFYWWRKIFDWRFAAF